MSRRPIDPQQHKSRLPDQFAGLQVRLFLPYICIAVLRASDDTIGIRGPVDGGNEFVMLRYSFSGIASIKDAIVFTSERVTVGTHSEPCRVRIWASLLFKLTASSVDMISIRSETTRRSKTRTRTVGVEGVRSDWRLREGIDFRHDGLGDAAED